jgi:hypothetical protein
MDGITVAARKLVAQTMNMMKTNKERGLFKIAAITGLARNFVVLPQTTPHAVYTLDWEESSAVISASEWHGATWSERLSLVQGVLALFNNIPANPKVQICWTFSGKTLSQLESVEVMDRWIDEDAPPVMDLIDFVAEDDGAGRWVRTLGLFPIVGHEIEVFIDRTSSKELPRVVGYLAQEVLRSGPVRTTGVIGPDGTEYQLDRIAESSKHPAVVRIIPINRSRLDQTPRA